MRYALHAGHAAIVFLDNGYGRTVTDGFKRGADRLGLPTTYHGYSNAAELDEALRAIAADPAKPAVVLATFDEDSVTALKALRRSGFTAPAVNTSGVSDEAFLARFANEPEGGNDPGFFTRNFYSVMPVMIDSANARTLSFMEYADSRLPGDRPDVPSTLVQAYDAARLTIAAVRQSAAMAPNGDIAARRAAVLKYLRSLDTPARGLPGLLGPLWFGPDRGRDLPMRVGVFRRGRLVSAPVQLVPVRVVTPDPDDIASGAVLETAPGHYVRRQQVVYTGIYLNEVSRIDIAQSTFTADFYVWMRFPQGVANDEADPTQIEFPGLVRGTFDSKRPDVHRDFGDGTTYRLWRVNGEFKDDFDLHGYPADSHVLNVRLLNARASSNRLVYVVDRGTADWGQEPRTGVSAGAFRNLSQWRPGRVLESRDALLTQSALGRPDLLGAQRQRELSGFDLRIEVHRRIGTTLVKTLLPVGLMTLILFASFYFPAALAGSRVMVAITAALSGTVLMTAINSQLGNVGYVIAVEYGFYAFFALCLVCIVTVLASEQRRVAEKPDQAVVVDRYGRYVFIAGLAATILAGFGVVWFGW